MPRLRDESGQALVLAALCMPLLLGFLGLALDVGLLSVEKRKVQEAADAAAIAGAAELNYGDYVSAAKSAAAQNGFTDGSNGSTVSVNPSGTSTPSPLYGAYQGQAGYLEVVVTQSTPTVFMSVFNWNAVTVSARAVAALGASSNCIYILSPSAELTINNDAQASTPGCGWVIDSSATPALYVSGSANLSASSVSVVGTASTDNSGSKISPSALTGVVPVSDPLGYLSPPSYTSSSCTADPGSHYQGGATYSVGPGSTYSTTQTGNLVCYTSLNVGTNGDTVTLNPGIYVITGALNFASGTQNGGNGVTFYLTGSGSVTIANGANVNLIAPTSGTYDGILFYQDRADSATANIQGGASAKLEGVLYFPDAQLSIANGTSSTIYAPIVAKTLNLGGGAGITDKSYASLNSSLPLSSPRLVE